ncbi:MAG: hypothetical protein RIM84_08070 [Alphaproteobacteria bacterium]
MWPTIGRGVAHRYHVGMAKHEHVISALVRKRAEIAGYLQQAEDKADGLRADLAHVDAVLRMFDPARIVEAIPPRPPRTIVRYFGHGQLSRRVIDTLRRAAEPMECADIAKAIMPSANLDIADDALVAEVAERVRYCLKHHRKNGRVVSSQRGKQVTWALIR